MCEQSGTHQQGPLIQEQDEDQNHVFQKHIVFTFSAIVCFSLCPHSVWKLKSFQFVSLKESNLNKRSSYSAKLLRFLPTSALFVNKVFLLFILILKNLSLMNKKLFHLPSIIESMQSLPADSQQLDFTINKSLLEMYSYFASIPLCNVAALTFMQLFMKTCVVAVFLKRHVRTWYCDRCLYCVNSYVL